MPPASMAKMMATHVAFDLIRRGELSPRQDVHGPPRDLAALARRRRRARPCSSRPASRSASRNLLHGIVTLSGNDATVVLAECISGTEPAFVALMNRQSRADGPRQFPLGQSGRLARRRRHLHHRARSRHARRGHDPRLSPALPRILRHARIHLGPHAGRQPADHPGATATRCSAASPAPTASRPAIPRRRATASPARPTRTAAASSWWSRA